MIKIKGKSVTEGAAEGKIAFSGRRSRVVRRCRITNISAEKARFAAAAKGLVSKLETGGDENRELALIISDPDFYNTVTGVISSQRVNAEFAAALAANSLFDLFSGTDDEYMNMQAGKILYAADLVIDELSDKNDGGDVIICTERLDRITDDDGRVKAVVSSSEELDTGGDIPAISCAGDIFKYDIEGKYALADGFEGILYIEPDEKTAAEIKQRSRLFEKRKELAEKLKDRDCMTLDGQHIDLLVFTDDPEKTGAAASNGAAVLKTDMLYRSKSLPSEDYQFSYYKSALERAGKNALIVSAFDIGTESGTDYLNLKSETDPSLGYRSTRIALTRSDILKTQFKALCRAAYCGKIQALVPMISETGEFKKAKEVLEAAKAELRSEHALFDENMPLGAAVETPSAALLSDELAAEADFIVINTDRLTKYTLAADMDNKALKGYFSPVPRAVMRLVAQSAKKCDKPLIICGRLAENTDVTDLFIAAGIKAFAVSPERAVLLKEKICGISIKGHEDEILKRRL